jgi:hypothetical protein
VTLRNYLVSALTRLESGEVSSQYGSHAAGIVGRATQQYEELWRACLNSCFGVTGTCYEPSIRTSIRGPARFAMLTLGKVIAAIEILHTNHGDALSTYLQLGSVPDLCVRMKEVNYVWRRIKHGTGVQHAEAVHACREMLLSLPPGEA